MRRREPRRIAIVPPPPWMSELAGFPVSRAVAWAATTTVRLSLASDQMERALVEWRARDGRLTCDRLIRAENAVEREPSQRWLALSADERRMAVRFATRLRWIGGLPELPGNAYRPTARERRVADVAVALAAVRDLEAARRFAWTPADSTDTLLHGACRFVDVLGARWADAFDASEVVVRDHPWLAPILHGLAGEVGAIHALAASPDAFGDGPATIVAAASLELLGLHDAAQATFERGARVVHGPERADLHVEIAKLCRVREDSESAVAWAKRALAGTRRDDLRRRACAELVRTGAFEDAYAVLADRCAHEPLDRGSALALAELLAWAGRTSEARAWLDRANVAGSAGPRTLGGDQTIHAGRLEGAVLALEERWEEARDAFTRTRAEAPRDLAVALWLCEIHLRLDDRRAAADELERSFGIAHNPIQVLLSAALRHAPDSSYTRPPPSHIEFEDSELHAVLRTLGVPPEPFEAVHPIAPILELLSSLGGNRGELFTRPVSRGQLGLELVRALPSDTAPSSRRASADTLARIRTTPAEEVERRFERLAERHRGSPHPLCYWGELQLWLGRYERALELFDSAHSRGPTRWIHVGRAAARMFLGDLEGSQRALDDGERDFPPLRAATSHVYAGELCRRRGDLEGALPHLVTAVEAKPGRAGAWVNLAWVRLARGDRDEAEQIVRMLATRHPRLCAHASTSLHGDGPSAPLPFDDLRSLLDRILTMMRGNRSSHTVTYFAGDDDDRLRVAVRADRWRETLCAYTPFVATELRTRLASA